MKTLKVKIVVNRKWLDLKKMASRWAALISEGDKVLLMSFGIILMLFS